MKAATADQLAKSLMDEPYVDDWPIPIPLEPELPPVAVFDERILPEVFRPLCCDVAERMQVPLDFPAAVAVLTLAGVVGRRARIQPKALDSSWMVTPNLWGGLIALPGQLKSPVISAITNPLRTIESGWRKEFEQAFECHRDELELHELRLSAWKEQVKRAAKNPKLVVPVRPSSPPPAPMMRRLTVNDATPESLHEIMAQNPAGILLVRDELTGWLAQLEKPGREGERAFALSSWNGDTPHTVDRIGRGHIHVPYCCMSLLGGIQPSRLRSYLADALADGPSNDGLIQRFQVLVWPETFTGRYVDLPPVSMYAEVAAAALARLAALDPEQAIVHRFTPQAQALFEAWYIINDEKAKSPETHPAKAAHLAKFRSLMPSLALLFALADDEGEGLVTLPHAKQAAAWCEYLESHAGRVYSSVSSPQVLAARDLGTKIKARKVGADGSFLLREVYLKGWTGLDSPVLARAAVETLIDAGWLRPVHAKAGTLGGRTEERYEVNPRVWS